MKLFGMAALMAAAVGCAGNGGSCSTDIRWTGGNEGSTLMIPGGDCTGCHIDRNEGPQYAIAGTVFLDYTDADNCYGVEGAEVVVTDSVGAEFTATTNAAGNFFLTTANPTYPATVVVRYQGGERAMTGEINDGNCNVCHTAAGDQGAPGRVIAP